MFEVSKCLSKAELHVCPVAWSPAMNTKLGAITTEVTITDLENVRFASLFRSQ